MPAPIMFTFLAIFDLQGYVHVQKRVSSLIFANVLLKSYEDMTFLKI